MDELQNVIRLVADADFIIKSVLAILLFQSVYIWFALIQFFFRAKKNGAERRQMMEAAGGGSIEEVRQTLYAFTHVRPVNAAGMGATDEGGDEELFESVWTEFYDILTVRCSGLATMAATAPFIGLLGTVWGILVAFSSIRGAEAITFSALAPAIGEALFATMAGLFVAIPSVIVNNFVTSRSLKLSRQSAQAYVALSGELNRLAKKPGTGEW